MEEKPAEVEIHNLHNSPNDLPSKMENYNIAKNDTSSFLTQPTEIPLNPKEIFAQIGLFLTAFSFAMIADSLVFLRDSLNEKYSMEQFNSNNDGTFDMSEEEFQDLVNLWGYLFGLTGIIIGIVQLIFSSILATSSSKLVKNSGAGKVKYFLTCWVGSHSLIFCVCVVLLVLSIPFQVYVPRVGVMLMAICGFDAFFIFLGFALIRVTLKEAKRDGIQIY